MKRIRDFIEVPVTDRDTAFRSRLLDVMVTTIIIGMFFAMIVDIVGSEPFTYFQLIAFSISVLFVIFGINYIGYSDIASGLFTLFIFIITTALRFLDDNSSILYIVPIVIAIVLFRYWAGILVAVCTVVAMLIPAPGNGFPVGPASIVFFSVAVILGVFAYGFQRSRQELVSLNEDLEERIALAQDELLIKERLATLGQLSGGISHELRSPLAAIQNAAELLQLRLDSTDLDAVEALDKILTEVEKSVKTIESLLGFAKARSPQQEKVNLNRLAQDLIKELEIPDSIEIVTVFDTDLRDIITDSFQIRGALTYIIVNAMEEMTDTGRMTLSTNSEGNGYVSITVSDTGPGLNGEQMSKLFRPLHTTKETGIGLGLTITRLLVEANGGKIEVESEPGAGTTFTIYLPKSN